MAKKIVSDLRLRAVFTLINEFSRFLGGRALGPVSKLLGIKESSIIRYLSEYPSGLGSEKAFFLGGDSNQIPSEMALKMTIKNRAIAALRKNEFSHGEIAKILKIKKESVKKHLQRLSKIIQ